jgi:hypothetical protein
VSSTSWDSVFNLPAPPVHTLYNDTVAFWAGLIYALFAVPVLIYALLRARDGTGRTMLLVMIGGALCATVEPLADVLGGCWHPEVGQPTVFELLGRGIPPWVCIGYFTYFGALGAVSYLLYSRGLPRKFIWLTFASSIVIDIIMENLMLAHGLYYYYGNQPLDQVGLLPLWWPPVNALGVELGAACVCLLRPHLAGWRAIFIPLVMPIADLATYGLVAYPGAIAVNADQLGPVITDLLGLATWALALIMMYGVTLIIAVDSPLRKGANITLTSAWDPESSLRPAVRPSRPMKTRA